MLWLTYLGHSAALVKNWKHLEINVSFHLIRSLYICKFYKINHCSSVSQDRGHLLKNMLFKFSLQPNFKLYLPLLRDFGNHRLQSLVGATSGFFDQSHIAMCELFKNVT